MWKMVSSSVKKIFILIFIGIIILILYISRSIIKPILFSIVLAYLINPMVELLVRRGLRKKTAVLLTLLLLLAFTFLGIFFIIPGLLRDMLEFLKNTDSYSSMAGEYLNKIGYDKLPLYLKNAANSSLLRVERAMVDYLNRFFNQLIDFTMELPTYILTPVFVYYFLIDTEYFLKIIKSIIPMRIRSKAIELGHEIDKIIGSFIKSQIILSIIIAVLTFFALIILKIRYAIIIAFINGITNIIPYFGPVIGLLPALFAGLAESVNKAIMVVAAFFVIQQVESSIVAPKLMGDTIGIHPVIVMIVLILGGKFFGGWGLVLSIPAAGAIKVTYRYIMKNLY